MLVVFFLSFASLMSLVLLVFFVFSRFDSDADAYAAAAKLSLPGWGETPHPESVVKQFRKSRRETAPGDPRRGRGYGFLQRLF